MNEIEQTFYDAWVEQGEEESEIKPGKVIGPYCVDFLIYDTIVIEIDGHESHKTKEQRSKDYQRERFLQADGYTVIRFMGTEVFLDAAKCVNEATRIACVYDEKLSDAYNRGVSAERTRRKEGA